MPIVLGGGGRIMASESERLKYKKVLEGLGFDLARTSLILLEHKCIFRFYGPY